MVKQVQVAAVVTALAVGVGIGVMSANSSADDHRMQWIAGEFPEEFVWSMEESADAFQRKDMEATRVHPVSYTHLTLPTSDLV